MDPHETSTTIDDKAVGPTRTDNQRLHVLDLDDFSTYEITALFDSARAMLEVLGRGVKKSGIRILFDLRDLARSYGLQFDSSTESRSEYTPSSRIDLTHFSSAKTRLIC